VCSFRRAVSRSGDPASHISRSVGEGHGGTGGIINSLKIGVIVSPSVSNYRGRLGLGIRVGGAGSIVIGISSEPVEGRETSQPLTIGRR